MVRSFRSLVVSILALWKGLSQKEVGARAGLPDTKVSYHLRRGDLADEALYQRLLAGVEARPAEVDVVTECLETLAALEKDTGLTAAEQVEVETGVLEISRLLRRTLTAAARRSRAIPALDVYPRPADLETARWLAGEAWATLSRFSEGRRLALVQGGASMFQTWALVERVCEESVVQASRQVERAGSLARLAQEIAGRVQGPEGWRKRVQGFAAAHFANVLRVAGDLKGSEAAFEQTRQLWLCGSDPDQVLDPGRLLDLEASLRRDQRRFEEALALLEEALRVGRCPERYLINKGFTLEVLGEYQRAVETLLQAEPLVKSQGDDRLMNILRLNLAWDFCHLGRFGEAGEIGRQVRAVAAEMGDEIGVLRALWLEGRIAAGLGRSEEARRLLAQARREFAVRGMGYDVALALLEEAALLLAEGRTAEVRALIPGLAQVFESKGVHREALAALRLFREAAEREEATAELARRVLAYLFRARHDQGLRFEAIPG